ncbi:MAG: DUF4197 domain-containing protein [Chitinophagaceae bacterium]
MKRILLSLCLSFVVLSSCDSLKQIANSIRPSEFEMVTGLKDALSQGLFRSFDAFADPNGNPFVRFVFPQDEAKIEKTLRDLGLDRLINSVTTKFTNATSAAVSAAKPIFLNSLKQMSIRDAVGILLTDNMHAATDYFKSTMTAQLMTAFRPIVDSTINVQGAAREWTSVVTVYNKLPFISKPLEASLTDFIAARAIDGMFSVVSGEEENIRTKYEFRKTDIMKKVFGYAEQELKRRGQWQAAQ